VVEGNGKNYWNDQIHQVRINDIANSVGKFLGVAWLMIYTSKENIRMLSEIVAVTICQKV